MDIKLLDLTQDKNFRDKVDSCMGHLMARGLHPRIYETKRTLDQQREKVAKGYSKTMNSYHLKRGKDGGSMAADVADRDTGWNASKRFWLMLGSGALAHSLGWGGLFGLNRKQRLAVVNAINEARDASWPIQHEAYQVPLGWDTAHLEINSNWP